MSQAFAFIIFAALFYLVNAVENKTITADDPKYVCKQYANNQWFYTFSPNLRGFLIFDRRFELEAGEELSVYNGQIILPQFRLANYTTNSTFPKQRLTFGMGQSITVIFTTNATAPTTLPPPLTTTTEAEECPTIFMFLVSAYDEPESLMNSTQISGINTITITNQSLTRSVKSYPNVTQYWHFYPADNTIQLNFWLINSSALNTTNNTATLTLYRGNANDLNDTSTIVKEYRNMTDFDTENHPFNYGETVSLYFNYPNNSNQIELGYLFNVVPHVNRTGTTPTPVTDASGNTVTIPTNTAVTSNVTGTSTVQTTTTSAAAPFIFSIAPLLISLIFQMCH